MSNKLSTDTSYLEVLKLLKSNIMRSTNVAEIGIVIKQNGINVDCKLLNDQTLTITCVCGSEDTFNKNDVVVILFTDTDFRTNLKKFRAGQELMSNNTKVFHTKNYGIILRKL